MLFKILNLENNYKKKFILLICFYFILSLTEFISIAAVIPLIGILIDENIIFSISFLNHYINYIKLVLPFDIYFSLSGIFIVFVILSWFIKYFSIKFTLKTSNFIGADLQFKIFKNYITRDYKEIIKLNTDAILAKLTLINNRAISYIIAYLQLISNLLLIFLISILLFYLNPKIIIIISTIMLSFFGIIYFINLKKLYQRGKEINISHASVVQTFQNTRGYFQELKLYNLEKIFLNEFNELAKSIAEKTSKNKILGETPRVHFEYLSMLIFIIILVFLKLNSEILINDIAFLAAFALSAQKILPAFNKIYSSLSEMKASEPAIQDILDFLFTEERLENDNKFLEDKEVNFKDEIVLKNLNFHYENNKNIFKNNLNLTIKKGDFIGIKGQTGSGKTTLINILCSLLAPTEGEILIDNINIQKLYLNKWRNLISLVPQNIFLLDGTIIQNIKIGSPSIKLDFDKIKNIFKATCVDKFVDKLHEKENYRVGQFGSLLSGGQKQRIGIARALFRDTEIIILDEPTSALDKNIEKKIFENLRNIKKTFIIVSHSNEVLEYCDKIIELK